MTYIKISDIINNLDNIIEHIYQPITPTGNSHNTTNSDIINNNYISFKKIGKYNKVDNILLYEQVKDDRSIKIYNVIYKQTEIEKLTNIIDIIKIILTENDNTKCLKFSFKSNDKINIDNKLYGQYIFYDDDEVIEEFDTPPSDIVNKLLEYI